MLGKLVPSPCSLREARLDMDIHGVLSLEAQGRMQMRYDIAGKVQNPSWLAPVYLLAGTGHVVRAAWVDGSVHHPGEFEQPMNGFLFDETQCKPTYGSGSSFSPLASTRTALFGWETISIIASTAGGRLTIPPSPFDVLC